MIALLTALFRALASLAELRAVGERYRLSKEIEADIREDEKLEASLRRAGDHLAADRVRERALRRVGIVAGLPDLPTPDAGTARRPAGADQDRDLHPDAG